MLDIPPANLPTVSNSQLFKLYRVLASHLKLSIASMPATIQGHASTPSICPIKCLQSRTFSIFCFFSSHMIHALLPSSWPPPYLFFSWCDSSKPRPMPRPSFADLPEGVHLTEPRPPFQGTIEVSNLDSFLF
jgi:hypothetical protein